MPYCELRGEERRPVRVPIRTEEGEGLDEWMVEVSGQGCRIHTPAIMNVGDAVALSILSDTRSIRPLRRGHKVGTIRWEAVAPEGRSEYGIEFN
jgi:hypothetical protein